jgi:hypothetical protein
VARPKTTPTAAAIIARYWSVITTIITTMPCVSADL